MEHNPNLKIHIEEDETEVSLESRLHDVLPVAKVLSQQFAAMTGWVLDYTPSEKARRSFAPDSNLPIYGQFETVDMAANVPANQSALHRGQCDQLLESINTILRRLEAAELTLWQHQHYSDDVNHAFQDFQFPSNDSDVLANMLRQAAKAMNATGAALYLLDDDTTQLNLRATIGPASAARQMETHRPLEHALADLEALVGSVVTITDPLIGESWKIPEPYQFGICVMLGEPSLPLGTVWFFFETAREANPQELKLLEDLCAKIGAELHSRGKGRQPQVESPLEQELQLTSKLNDCRLPSYPPEIDGWKVTGWTYRQEPLAGVFHEWAVTPSGQLSIAVGQVAGPMLPATINANNLRSLICAHREYRHVSNSMVAKLNENIWNNSPGDAFASLIYVLVDPDTNLLQAVNAGDGGMVFGNQTGVQSIDQFQNPLGVDLDSSFEQWQCDFEEDDTLVLFSQGLRNALSETMSATNDAELLAEIIVQNCGDAEAILQAIEEKFFASDFQHVAGDLSVVVLTRNSHPDAMSLAAAEELRAIESELSLGDVDLLSALEDEIAALERLGFVRPNRNVIEPGMIEIEAEDLYGPDGEGFDEENSKDKSNQTEENASPPTSEPEPANESNSEDVDSVSEVPNGDELESDLIDEGTLENDPTEEEATASAKDPAPKKPARKPSTRKTPAKKSQAKKTQAKKTHAKNTQAKQPAKPATNSAKSKSKAVAKPATASKKQSPGSSKSRAAAKAPTAKKKATKRTTTGTKTASKRATKSTVASGKRKTTAKRSATKATGSAAKTTTQSTNAKSAGATAKATKPKATRKKTTATKSKRPETSTKKPAKKAQAKPTATRSKVKPKTVKKGSLKKAEKNPATKSASVKRKTTSRKTTGKKKS